MAVNYTTKYASKIAERFKKGSITDAACGHEYSFVGAKTIRVYSVNTTSEQQYDRTAGSNRFGDPANLDDTIQELTCTQQPALSDQEGAVKKAPQATKAAPDRAVFAIDTKEIEKRVQKPSRYANQRNCGSLFRDFRRQRERPGISGGICGD